MRPDFIIIHHSLTKDSGTVSWGSIRNYHTGPNGWSDIGYHFGVELVQSGQSGGYALNEYEILLGRMPDQIGAHCLGKNSNSVGVCVVGNFDEGPVPPRQWAKALQLVRWLRRQYEIPVERVLGHREAAPNRTCPGKNFDMDRFRKAVFEAWQR